MESSGYSWQMLSSASPQSIFPQQPLQLVHIVVDFCDLLCCCFRVDELYSRWLYLQVITPLMGPASAPAYGTLVVLPLPHGHSIEGT